MAIAASRSGPVDLGIGANMLESSAYKEMWVVSGRLVGRSAMYIVNSVAASMEPWGTPLRQEWVWEEHLDTRTKKFLLVRKAESQLR